MALAQNFIFMQSLARLQSGECHSCLTSVHLSLSLGSVFLGQCSVCLIEVGSPLNLYQCVLL